MKFLSKALSFKKKKSTDDKNKTPTPKSPTRSKLEDMYAKARNTPPTTPIVQSSGVSHSVSEPQIPKENTPIKNDIKIESETKIVPRRKRAVISSAPPKLKKEWVDLEIVREDLSYLPSCVFQKNAQKTEKKHDAKTVASMIKEAKGYSNFVKQQRTRLERKEIDVEIPEEIKDEFEKLQESDKYTDDNHVDLEEIFKDAGKQAGLEVWRIDKLIPVKVDESEHGKLNQGDCYIILHTHEAQDEEKRSRQIYIWMGSKSSMVRF